MAAQNSDQVAQVQRLLRALRKAKESIQGMNEKQLVDNSISQADRGIALGSLGVAICMLEEPRRNRYDLPTSTRTFLGPLDIEERRKIVTVLSDQAMHTLTLFGARSPERLQTVLDQFEMKLPLALMRFHSAYQHELRLITTPPPGKKPLLCRMT